MTTLTVACYGSFAARRRGAGELSFPTRRSRALLAYLAVEGDGWHSRDTLAGLFWPNSKDEAARRSLRQELSTLRSVVGDAHLQTDGDRIKLAGVRLDANRSGPFLGDFTRISEPFDEWVRQQRARSREQTSGELEAALEAALTGGRLADAIGAARQLLQLDATRETTHRALMTLLVRSGQPTAALKQYRACVAALRRELEVAPSPETRELYESIRANRERSRRRILVVDDNPVTRVQLEALLTAERFDVSLADHGANALLDLGADAVDLVVTDIDMPKLDGLTLLEVLRGRSGPAPVLVITGLEGRDVERRARSLGATGFVRKPIDARAFLLAVRKALRGPAGVKKSSKRV